MMTVAQKDMRILLSGTSVVQVGHGLVDGLHNTRDSGSGCHVDSVQVVIGTNKDDVGVGWACNSSVQVQV